MKKLALYSLVALFMFGCQDSDKHLNLDGEKLLKQKCSSCHNLDLPPKTFENEVAPPMMAVAFHVSDFIKVNQEDERVVKSIAFVKDYVVNPSVEKSFCDKESLKAYGLMPSQKGKVTQDELQAIAEYIFSHYTPKNLQEAQAIQRKLDMMPKGQRLALQNNCLTCHRVDKDLVGPSFASIAKKYKNDTTVIQESIANGSSKKYKNFRGVLMPTFKDKISKEDIKTISEWIVKR
ncbi:MAG: c-type cytochrome [Campylobacterales bacterium]